MRGFPESPTQQLKIITSAPIGLETDQPNIQFALISRNLPAARIHKCHNVDMQLLMILKQTCTRRYSSRQILSLEPAAMFNLRDKPTSGFVELISDLNRVNMYTLFLFLVYRDSTLVTHRALSFLSLWNFERHRCQTETYTNVCEKAMLMYIRKAKSLEKLLQRQYVGIFL